VGLKLNQQTVLIFPKGNVLFSCSLFSCSEVKWASVYKALFLYESNYFRLYVNKNYVKIPLSFECMAFCYCSGETQ